MQSSVHLVEIDLLRGGPRLPPDELEGCDYYVIVSRAESRPMADFWPIRLRDRLPEIPIPLHDPAQHARLDLQQAMDRLYDAAGYEYYVYDAPPQPALRGDDVEWARQLVSRTNGAFGH